MARIPVYREQQQVGQGMGVRQVSAPSFAGAAEMGRALQQVGTALGQVAQARINVEEENAKAWAANASADSALQWTTRLKELQENTEPGARNFTSNLAKEFDPWAEETLKAAPTESARKFLQNSLLQLRNNVFSNAITFEATEGRNHRFALINEGIGKAAQAIYLDPTEERLGQILGEQQALIDSMNDTPSRKTTLSNNLRTNLGRAGAEAMAMNQPEVLIAQVETAIKKGKKSSGNPFLDLLNPTEWDTYLNRAQTVVRQQQATFRADFERRLGDASAMALDGIVNPEKLTQDQFVAAYGEDGPRRFNDYQLLQNTAVNISKMKTMDSAGIAQMLQNSKPKPGAGYEMASKRNNILTQAASKMINARNDDPALYAIESSSAVNLAYRQMSILLADPNATPQQRTVAANQYASAALAEQQRLGVLNPRILSKSAVDSIQRQFINSDDNELTSTKVRMLSEMWGNNWPTVYGQLVAEKALPDSAIVIGSGMTGTGAINMATASKLKVDDMLVGMPSGTKKDLTDSVANQLEPLRRTLVGSGGLQMNIGANETFKTFFDATVQLGAYYTSQGMSTSDAAKRAADDVVNTRYAFKDTYRVPLKTVNGNPTSFNPNVIANNTRFVMSNLQASDLYIPPTLRKDSFVESDYLKNIKRRGYWINSKNDDGLVLMNADTGAAVLNKNGSEVFLTYGELMVLDEFSIDTIMGR